ncbi:MAG: FAD/NAD(P)-binding protein [Pirellulaceae bacterium]|nr:FAD/NAD(P)-binding protein [Planctomycetales bacterium]
MMSAAMDHRASSPWTVHWANISKMAAEVPGVTTYELTFGDPLIAREYQFSPGQFNMLYLPGVGESAISISSDPAEPEKLEHTVRVAGNVTRAMSRLHVGDQIGIRGPYGSAWPMRSCREHDVVIACGGIGLAPLRPAIHHIIHHRDDYGRVYLLYGARTAKDLLYTEQYDAWRNAGIEVEVTVDIGDAEYRGHIGVVPILFYRLRLKPERTRVLTCGPEVMMRFVIFEALARKIKRDHIHVSMERNMSCAVGLCGHCQLGPTFVCKDGPVFTYQALEPYLNLENF